MSDTVLDAAAVADLDIVLRKHANNGDSLGQVQNSIREVCEAHAWDWFTKGTKADFNRRCMYLYRAFSYSEYSHSRSEQLSEFDFWIFRYDPDCPDRHEELDRLFFPREHPFWQHNRPPLDADCSCYIVGARSERAALRMGGQPGKEVPAWATQERPKQDLTSLLYAILNDELPPLDEGS